LYRSALTRERVEQLVVDQQELIVRWKSRGFDLGQEHAARLRALVGSALELPFYAELYRGIDVDGLDHAELLRALPLTGKADAHRVGEEVLAFRRDRLAHYFETTGTTGTPTPAPKSLAELAVNTVNFGESWAEFLTPQDRALVLINTPQGPAAHQFEKVLNYLGIMTFRTWVDTLRNDYGRVLEIIERCGPTVWAGPPSQLINLYEHAHRVGAKPPQFEKVLLTGEPSGPALKRRLAELSGGRVLDASYGSSETGTTALAWGGGENLRLQTQSYLFELATEAGVEPVTPGFSGTGELVVTSLQNLNRPLIRYRTGDLVTITAQEDGAQILTPLGRVKDQVHIGELRFSQAELESLLWPEQGSSGVFNYMLAYDATRTDVIVTADDSGPVPLRESLSGLTRSLPGVSVHVVPKLPVVSSLGSAMGWKASRILDLRDTSRGDFSATVADALREARAFVGGLDTEAGVR
jgi:phenylacetate-CoA ligase